MYTVMLVECEIVTLRVSRLIKKSFDSVLGEIMKEK